MSDYQAKYGQAPDDVAALTYDAFGLLVQAVKDAGKLDRQAVRDALAKIPKYDGITGNDAIPARQRRSDKERRHPADQGRKVRLGGQRAAVMKNREASSIKLFALFGGI